MSTKSTTTSVADTPEMTVRYSMTTPEKHPSVYAWALKVEVLSARVCSDHVFLFQRSKAGTDGDWTDTFIQVASPLDIEETPENAPDLQNNMPYYRASSVTLWFRTADDLSLARDKIRDDLRTLTATYNLLKDGYDTQKEERYE